MPDLLKFSLTPRKLHRSAETGASVAPVEVCHQHRPKVRPDAFEAQQTSGSSNKLVGQSPSIVVLRKSQRCFGFYGRDVRSFEDGSAFEGPIAHRRIGALARRKPEVPVLLYIPSTSKSAQGL